jgi:uncharacterized protein (TIGR00297 family)
MSLSSSKHVNVRQAERFSGWRLLLGLLFSSAIALLAYRRRSLSRSGVVGAMVTGTVITGMAGWSWGLTLIYFFVSSSLFSHLREREKAVAGADKFSKGSRRDIVQAAANGGLATLCALAYGLSSTARARRLLQAAFTGALAAANADTWATELGILSASKPRLITSWGRVPPGTSGGVTLLGSAASALGALTLGLFFWIAQGCKKPFARLPVLSLCSGMAGSLFDSFLGATVQAMYYCPSCQTETERRVHHCGTPTTLLRGVTWMNNDTVNFLATLCGGAVAVGMAPLILPL